MSRALLLLALAPAALASEPPFPDRGLEVADPYDYETNVTWSEGPIEGLRDLYGEPASLVGALAPVAPVELPAVAPPAPDVGGMPAMDRPPGGDVPPVVSTRPIPKPKPLVPPTGNLVLVNRASGWATVAINGEKMGVIGPLAMATVYGVPAGQYDVSFTTTTAYTWTERVQTCPVCTAADWPPRR